MKVNNLSVDAKIKLLSLLNHALVLYGLLFYFSWMGIFVGYVLGYLICLVGISIGYHRYFTHKAFDTTPAIERILVVVGSLGFLGPVIGWVGIHRLHHATSDTDKDPHSPSNGFVRSWLHIFKNKNVPVKLVSDLLRNPVLKFQHKHYFKFMISYLILMYILFGAWAIYIVSLPAIYQYHITGMVNSLHHLKKDSKYNLSNNSLDIPILNIFTAGESYHAFHHYKASAPIFGKYDPARFIIPFIRA